MQAVASSVVLMKEKSLPVLQTIVKNLRLNLKKNVSFTTKKKTPKPPQCSMLLGKEELSQLLSEL